MSTSTAATPQLSSVLPKHILTSGDHHPIVLAEAERRAASAQLRIADVAPVLATGPVSPTTAGSDTVTASPVGSPAR